MHSSPKSWNRTPRAVSPVHCAPASETKSSAAKRHGLRCRLVNFFATPFFTHLILGGLLVVAGTVWAAWAITIIRRPDVPVRVERETEGMRSDR